MVNHLKLNLLNYDSHLVYLDSYEKSIDFIKELADSIKVVNLVFDELTDKDANELTDKIQLCSMGNIWYGNNNNQILNYSAVNNQAISGSYTINTTGAGTGINPNYSLGNVLMFAPNSYTTTSTNFIINDDGGVEDKGLHLNLNQSFFKYKNYVYIYNDFKKFLLNVLPLKNSDNSAIYYGNKCYTIKEFSDCIKIQGVGNV